MQHAGPGHHSSAAERRMPGGGIHRSTTEGAAVGESSLGEYRGAADRHNRRAPGPGSVGAEDEGAGTVVPELEPGGSQRLCEEGGRTMQVAGPCQVGWDALPPTWGRGTGEAGGAGGGEEGRGLEDRGFGSPLQSPPSTKMSF